MPIIERTDLKKGNKKMKKMQEYENIMNRLSKLADENSMVSLDAVAEVVNQELDGSLHPSANEQF